MTAVLERTADALVVENVRKEFGGRTPTVALADFTLTVRRGELVCVVGSSGCGKSTLLSLVAGLDAPTSGTVTRTGERVALMFQDAALFPWLTVGANVALALKLRGVPKAERPAETQRLLGVAHLASAARKRPHELSGGMRQRAALARALAQQADLLLLDEPFGALDAMTRDKLHDELERIWMLSGLTALFVTHNVREAVRLADRIVVLASRPGPVVAEVTVDLPRPRRIDSQPVAELAAGIADLLREQVSA
jgi:NitT/TauT family transport system ATP-binding protein